MSDTNYARARAAVKAEIEALVHQRDAVNEKIAKLYPIFDYLNALCDKPDDPILNVVEPQVEKELGLSDAIRHVLRKASPASMSPTGIRDGLAEIGFNLKKYANVMPPIHNTLKRMEYTGEIKVLKSSYGKSYQWRGEIGRTIKSYEMDTTPDEK
jgi:hypothetical protein